MKYLAVLRDSFRESLDSKMLYVTFGLSAIVILFVASIGIRPLTMEEELKARARLMQFITRSQQQNVSLVVEDFKQTNDAVEPWHGDYEFTFVLRAPLPEGMPEDGVPAFGRSLINDTVAKQLAPFVEAFFWRLNIRSIAPQKAPPNEFRLRVVSKGTKINQVKDWNHEPVLFFGALPIPWLISSPAAMVYFIENNLVDSYAGGMILLLGIVATASFVPNMLRKGSVDLLLSKPVTRVQLLIFKYLGGLTFLFLSASAIIGAVWVIVGLRSGIWNTGFLLIVPILTFFFAVLYAVSVLVAVLTRSTVVAILLTLVAWGILVVIGVVHGLVFPEPVLQESVQARMEEAQERRGRGSQAWDLPDWASSTVNALYKGLPRTRDLSKLTARLLNRELLSEAERRADNLETPAQTSWLEALGVSTAWIVLLLGAACWVFARRDY